MILKKMVLDNFGSYEHLEFNFNESGLTLIQGPTGAGKSTLFDGPAWVCYTYCFARKPLRFFCWPPGDRGGIALRSGVRRLQSSGQWAVISGQ